MLFSFKSKLYLRLQLLSFVLSAVNIVCVCGNILKQKKLKNNYQKKRKTEHCGVTTYQKLLYFYH